MYCRKLYVRRRVHFKNLNFSKLNPANNVILQPFAELKPPWINQIIPYICPTYKNKFFAILYNLLQFSRKIKSNPPKSPHFSLPLSHLHNFGEEKSKIFISLPASAAAPPALISIRGPPGRSPIPLWPPARKAGQILLIHAPQSAIFSQKAVIITRICRLCR